MRVHKSNFTVYTSLQKAGTFSKPANIVDLIKKNRVEEKKDKIFKIYTMVGFVALILILSLMISL